MKRLIVGIVVLLAFMLSLTGCESINWGAVTSIGSDLITLRSEREASGQEHIEDVFVKDETTGEDR